MTANDTPFLSGLSALASTSPVLRAAEELVPGGAAIVCLAAAFSFAVMVQSWFTPRAKCDPSAAHDTRRRDPASMLARIPDGSKEKPDRAWKKELLPNRYASLRAGETEPANLPTEEGGFEDLRDECGIFACAGCGAHLYDNDARYEAGCGWPCFFTCLKDAVRERKDKDETRMEIVCNACNGHLGHIFRNEGWNLPPPAERHCVNCRSMIFIPTEASDEVEDEDLAKLDVD
jgi:peptide-methionine (R)-S-oxide reductase